MDWSARSLARLVRPRIANERDLRVFVLRIVAIAVLAAFAVDAVQQLVFFTSWEAVARSWTITVAASGLIAAPIAYILGRAQLELNRTRQALEEMTRTDPLTGLANRRWLLEAIEEAGRTAIVLVLVDIDNFKRVNDLRGHRVGDAVVRHIGTVMKNELGATGMVGRFGGDEFALVAADPDIEALIQRLSSFRDVVARSPLVVDGAGVLVSISAGVALRDGGETFDQLYTEADEALYAAKAAGRNRICLSPGIRARAGMSSSFLEGRSQSVA